MRVAIMQPYFFPYIGYFQLIRAVDLFIVYDNIQYTKKGWINRNRILQNGEDAYISLPLKKDSDYLDVCEREISPSFDINKLLRQISGSYRRAPCFEQTFALIEQIVNHEETNLFHFLHHSILSLCGHLAIDTEIRTSSSFAIDPEPQNQDKVISLCVAAGANTYVNAIGGQGLYSENEFLNNDIELKFIHSEPHEYEQFDNSFVPWLSIIDVMMFNQLDEIRSTALSDFKLV